MDFLLNDYSLPGQFRAHSEFYEAASTVMQIRACIRNAGRELFCHKALANALITPSMTMPQVIQSMDRDARLVWTQWLTRQGPFWVDQRQHSEDEWLEIEDGTLVTDSGVAEAAYCLLHNVPRQLVSFCPSGWLRTPVQVLWRWTDQLESQVEVPNHWTTDTVEETLASLPLPFHSWESLEQHLRNSCDQLLFADDFLQFHGYLYVKSVAERICMLMQVLNKVSMCFNEAGNRTQEFTEIYETYFMGVAPYFTDESTQNKNDFCRQMKFPHPSESGETVFCPWHGKVNTPKNFPPVRIHFTWPIRSKGELYVPYAGKKITMK